MDESQSAFLPGRQIQDNIIIAMKCIKSIYSKNHGPHYAAAKLDLSKVLDRVEWTFITDSTLLASQNLL